LQLVPSLVGPLLEVSLVPQREVRQTLLPLLFRLMETEQAHKGNFRWQLLDFLFIFIYALIKKKIKFSSYIRKFRVKQLQSHI
jgi:hypothetical protein